VCVQCTTGGAVFIVSSSEPISKKEIPGTVPVPYNSEDGICLVCKCKSGTVHVYMKLHMCNYLPVGLTIIKLARPGPGA